MAIITKKKFSGSLTRMARLNKELANELRDVLAYLHWSELNGNADAMKEFKASKGLPAWIRDLGAHVAAKPNDNLTKEEKAKAAEDLAADVVIKAFMSQQEKRDAAKAKREAKKAEAAEELRQAREAEAKREAEREAKAEAEPEQTPEPEQAPEPEQVKAPAEPAPEEFILGHYGGKDDADTEMSLTKAEYAAALKAVNALRSKALKPKAA